ncbi:MAG TPA: ABC transporter substrate-binding protein [Acetobacteraceae bacterium]|nr:ABC transporter substrate-binding protein [Acetobacteraceae bacterium]
MIRIRLLPILAALVFGTGAAGAQIPNDTVKIGVLTDASGPFADQSGRGALIAAQLAAEDFAKEAPNLKVEVVFGDHQNKANVGASIVRAWVDREGVTAVTDTVNSTVGLAVNQIMREKHLTFLATNVGTSDLTGKQCSPVTVQWTMDTWAFGNAAARAMVKEGGDTWFFISFDYALGQALERDTTEALKKLGARVLGSVKHPLGTTDFASYLVAAQASGAKVVALADTGADLINAVKQAHEFGLTRDQRLVGLFTQIVDVKAIGLDEAQGLIVTEAFYWDHDDATRAWSRRFAERMGGRMPTANQAGVYSSVLAYLRAVRKANTVEGEKVVAQMRQAPIQDPLFGTVTIRPDGRAVHAMYVFRVKHPGESRGPWDVYTPVATIPPEEAFRPINQGGCPLVGG